MNVDDAEEVLDTIRRETSNEIEKTDLWMAISKKVIKESGIIKLEGDGEIEWSFNVRLRRLFIKGKGPLENKADRK